MDTVKGKIRALIRQETKEALRESKLAVRLKEMDNRFGAQSEKFLHTVEEHQKVVSATIEAGFAM